MKAKEVERIESILTSIDYASKAHATKAHILSPHRSRLQRSLKASSLSFKDQTKVKFRKILKVLAPRSYVDVIKDKDQ